MSFYKFEKEIREKIKILAKYKNVSESRVISAAIENEFSWCKSNLRDFPGYKKLGLEVVKEKENEEDDLLAMEEYKKMIAEEREKDRKNKKGF